MIQPIHNTEYQYIQIHSWSMLLTFSSCLGFFTVFFFFVCVFWTISICSWIWMCDHVYACVHKSTSFFLPTVPYITKYVMKFLFRSSFLTSRTPNINTFIAPVVAYIKYMIPWYKVLSKFIKNNFTLGPQESRVCRNPHSWTQRMFTCQDLSPSSPVIPLLEGLTALSGLIWLPYWATLGRVLSAW